MAGARALWVANGMKKEMIGKPIIAIVNSFTQFVPGHTHLHEIGQQVKAEIEKKEKQAVVAKYEKLLDAEVIEAYNAKLDEYTDIKMLDKDLAYELVSTNGSVFTANGHPQPAYVPKDEGAGNGLEAILNKYKK